MRPLDPALRDGLLAFLEERFGITGLAELSFFALGDDRIHLASPEAAAAASALPCVVAGLPCARISEGGAAIRFKPSTVLFQWLDARITKNRVALLGAQATEFIAGRDIALAAPAGVSDGFVAICFRGRVLGCGLLKGGSLKSQVPRAKRIAGARF